MADKMTEPEELGCLSIWGLLKESYKVVLSHTKLFIALSLTLIVPLCVVGLGHSLITEPIANRITWDEIVLGSHAYNHTKHDEDQIDHDLHKELSMLLLVMALYLFALLAFSLLSTSAIVYSVACIYSDKTTSFKKVLSVVPRVWKRLIVTFVWAFLMMFAYGILCFIAVLTVGVVFGLIFQGVEIVTTVVVWGGMLGFFAGIIYLNCVWHLGSVVTVLEANYGLGAMSKSLKLIQGKQLVAFCLFFIYFVVTFLIGLGFEKLVVHGRGPVVVWRAALGGTLILLLSVVDLMGFLVQTVFYFACKAHHRESIDRLQLSEHLGAYLGDYVPLRGSIQLEAFEA